MPEIPELSWAEIIALLRQYAGVYWETRDVVDSPWNDPDGGELRVAMTLQSLAEAAVERGPDAAISTDYLRRHCSRMLAPETTTVERG